MSEKAMREAAEKSGLDYTVVRPGSLTDAKRPKDACLVRRDCLHDPIRVRVRMRVCVRARVLDEKRGTNRGHWQGRPLQPRAS